MHGSAGFEALSEWTYGEPRHNSDVIYVFDGPTSLNSMLSNNVSHERAVAGASVSPFGWNESTTMPNHDYAASGSQYVEPYGNNGYFNRTPHGPSTMTSPLTSVLALDAAVAQPTPGSPFYSSQPDTVSYHLNPEWTPPSMATATWQPPTFNNYAYQPAAIVSTGATAGTGWQVTQPFVNTQQHYYHGYRADHASGLSAFLAPHPTALSLDASSPVLGYMPVSADQHGHQQQQQSFMTVAPPPSQSSIPFLTESSVAEASPAVSPTASMASIVSSAAAVTAAETTTNGSPASMPAPSSSAMAIGGHPLADTAVEGSSTMAGGGAQDDDGNALGNAEAPLAANPVVAAGPAATTARGAAFRARQATLLAIALQRQRSAADAATQAAGQQQAPSLDEKLLLYRAQNMTYRDLHARLVSEGFNIAESTVRGRLRTLLIEKERRPRQPQWNRNQIILLLQAALLYPKLPQATASARRRIGQTSTSQQQQQLPRQPTESPVAPGAFRRAFTAAITAGIDPGRVQWSKVVDYIELFGGYRFGVTTCKRKFVAVMSRGLAENADENNNHDGGNDMGVNGVADE